MLSPLQASYTQSVKARIFASPTAAHLHIIKMQRSESNIVSPEDDDTSRKSRHATSTVLAEEFISLLIRVISGTRWDVS